MSEDVVQWQIVIYDFGVIEIKSDLTGDSCQKITLESSLDILHNNVRYTFLFSLSVKDKETGFAPYQIEAQEFNIILSEFLTTKA